MENRRLIRVIDAPGLGKFIGVSDESCTLKMAVRLGHVSESVYMYGIDELVNFTDIWIDNCSILTRNASPDEEKAYRDHLLEKDQFSKPKPIPF